LFHPAGSYAVFLDGPVGPSLLEASFSGSGQGLFYSPTSRSNRGFIYPGGWQAGVSGERCCMPRGRTVEFWRTHQCHRHASCREPNLPHYDLLTGTAGSGSIIPT
jgi:hypothetical protein